MAFFQSDNSKLFHALFREYYAALVLFALRFVESQEAAEDVVQDVFVKIWETKDELDRIENLPPYLYQMVRYRCLNHIRAQKLRLAPQSADDVENADDPTDSYIFEDSLRIVMSAVDQLPRACREVFLLHLQGYSAKEIAEKLSIASETVKKQKQIARKILREKITL